jgi:UDP-N-acetylmuramate--alanine ligase
MQKYHFIGIGGNGMSALAQIYAMRGYSVSGSDKFLDADIKIPLWDNLKKLGIKFYPQDGIAVTGDLDGVIVSSAISKDNPDYKKAESLGLKLTHRSRALADIISKYKVIAVSGTSGKSTTTAMIFRILYTAGLKPSIITGGPLLFLMEQGLVGNVYLGKSDIMVIEADESDGSFVNYHPETALLLNLTKDHKELHELNGYFETFRKNCKKFITNADENNLVQFKPTATFGLKKGKTRAREIKLTGSGSHFKIENVLFTLSLPGLHNVSNAAAAVSVGLDMGIDLKTCSKALKNFKGTYRRFNTVGVTNGIEVIDDFAHNPEKIKASIKCAQLKGKRVLAFYQPHGYAPLKVYGDELNNAFINALRENDYLWLSDVYYMGGTPIEAVSVENIYDDLKTKHKNIFYVPSKENIVPQIAKAAKPGDVVLIMGARDPLLNDYSHQVFRAVSSK